MRYFVLLVLCIVGFSTVQAHGNDHEEPVLTEALAQLLSQVRAGTFEFRELSVAEVSGYGKVLDCFVNREIGGMGQHYVSGTLAEDAVLDPLLPEALVYEPTEDGDLVLVAFEYLVFADVWDAHNDEGTIPVLFDQEFHLKTNIPGTPPVWALHVWLWAHNPEGIFADYNPLVFCPEDQPITDMTP